MTDQNFKAATVKLLKKFEEFTEKPIEEKLATAAKCFEAWKRNNCDE